MSGQVTITDDPKPAPDASVTSPPPTTSAAPPKAPVKLPPFPPWERDAGSHEKPTEPEHPPAEPDAGHGCRSNFDCDVNLGTGWCRVDTGQCVQCLSDFACMGSASTPRCDLNTNTCACLTNTDCRYSYGACDTLTRTCMLGCTSQASCASLPFAPFCALDRGICVECRTSNDCKDKTFLATPVPNCNVGFCAQCASDADCSDSAKHCSTHDGICVDCSRPEHCPQGTLCINAHCVPDH